MNEDFVVERSRLKLNTEEINGGGKVNFQLYNGIGIIAISGVMIQRPDLFDIIFGAVSTSLIKEAVIQARNNKKVKRILLFISSPGGGISGIQELAYEVNETSKIKPIIVFSDDMIASGAYWVASGANLILLGSQVTSVGSIGAANITIDISARDKQLGLKWNEIYTGKKYEISTHKPLSDLGRSILQERVNKLADVFIKDISIYRKTDEKVFRDTEALILIGDDAINIKLVDGYEKIENILYKDWDGLFSNDKARREKEIAELTEANETLKGEKNALNQKIEELKKKIDKISTSTDSDQTDSQNNTVDQTNANDQTNIGNSVQYTDQLSALIDNNANSIKSLTDQMGVIKKSVDELVEISTKPNNNFNSDTTSASPDANDNSCTDGM